MKKREIGYFENALTEEHKIHYSRYAISWLRIYLNYLDGTDVRMRVDTIFGEDFKEWLISLGLSENEISMINMIAKNGKLELEDSARAFIKEKQKERIKTINVVKDVWERTKI